MIFRGPVLLGSLLLATGLVAAPALELAPLFADGAVLQRDVAHPVWGRAQPGAEVRVSFAGQTQTARVAEDGSWRVTLAPLAGTARGTELKVAAGRETRVVRDVVVGEVWLCSGQSNMEWTLQRSPALPAIEARGAVPEIRQFKVARAVAGAPATTLAGEWQTLSPATAKSFSAVAYHFAAALQSRLGVPIGVVNSTWGATAVEAWMPAGALARFPAIATRWERALEDFPARQAAYEAERTAWKEKAAAMKARGEKPGNDWPKPPEGRGTRRQPGGLFNAMIAPLVPFPFRGVLWYQAEGNTGRAAEYAEYFPAMIEGWRAVWSAPEPAWFFFVQLPNYNVPNDKTGLRWAELRAAQAAALALPRTGMAATIDVGVPDNGHPPDKTAVGQRLARLAAGHVYALESGDLTGPVARAARLDGAEVIVEFSSAASGLALRDESAAAFEVTDAAGTAHPATARVDGTLLRVAGPAGVAPAAVRYAWRNHPPAPLFNGAGLPAAPFQILVHSAAPNPGGPKAPNPTSR